MSQDHADFFFALTSPESSNFSVASAAIRDSNNFLVVVDENFVRLTFTLSASHVNVIQKLSWGSQINVFHQSFPLVPDCAFSLSS